MTIKEVQRFLESHEWTFAKTMPESPHWYIHKRNANDLKSFIEVVKYIQQNGLLSEFENNTYNYLHLDKYKYWTMGNSPEETTIINRTLI
jgi:hypothetical protein